MGWRIRQRDEDREKLREEQMNAAQCGVCGVCGGAILDPLNPDQEYCSSCINNAEKPD